jgi:crotonobetainyl-CoA:carnitine CoA-transferase CaiB-like acyl-CoA transferase
VSGPLAGTRVIDLARLIPGDYATQVLADLGAEVVKVEQPGTGDGIRATPPFGPDGTSGAHALLNRGKGSVTVDLKQPEGREILLALVAGADVLVDSFRPGVLDRLGLGPDVLAQANPALVHASVTFHGHSSPLAERAGHDLNAQALAGLLALGGGPEGAPAQPYVQAADHVAGLQAAIAVLAGLRARDRSGTGSHWDVAMVDAAYSLLGLAGAGFAVSGQPPQRPAALTGGLACYGTYVCADGRAVAVGALEPPFFARVLDVLGLPSDALADQYRPEAQRALRERLAAALGAKPREEWLEVLEAADCCVTPVNSVDEAMGDPAAVRRGLVQQVEGGFARLGPVPPPPGGQGAVAAARPAPPLGADTDTTLAALGYDPARIAELRQRGVV